MQVLISSSFTDSLLPSSESIKDAVGRKIKLAVKKRVKLEIKGDKVENRVLVSRLSAYSLLPVTL